MKPERDREEVLKRIRYRIGETFLSPVDGITPVKIRIKDLVGSVSVDGKPWQTRRLVAEGKDIVIELRPEDTGTVFVRILHKKKGTLPMYEEKRIA